MDVIFTRNGKKFCWDKFKNEKNLAKHKIDFTLASYVFDDLEAPWDDDPYPEEQRYRVIGMIGTVCVFVVWTERFDDDSPDEPMTRIISARRANRSERQFYDKATRGG